MFLKGIDMNGNKIYLCIDLKSFYASVECVERGWDPLTARLVVADPERSEKTICLAVSPALKQMGVPNRCRVFQIPKEIPYKMAPPRMQLYIDYAAEIYGVYLKYIAKEEVQSAMEDLKVRTGLAPLECTIKNLKATWGICSSKKKISINQNLMAYSRHAIEYVCLHEICHLKHMNHSKQFWNMVEYYMPDYKEAKKELKS